VPSFDNSHLVIRWRNDGNISTSIANWVPPDDEHPPSAPERPTKKFSKGFLHAQDILGEYSDPAEIGTTEAVDLDGPRRAPSEYLKIRHTPLDVMGYKDQDIISWHRDYIRQSQYASILQHTR